MSHRFGVVALILAMLQGGRLSADGAVPTWSTGQAQSASSNDQSTDGIWQTTDDRSMPAATRRTDIRGPYAVVHLNKTALDRVLTRAPNEETARTTPEVVMTLPLPDGQFGRFRIEEASVLSPELAAAFPGVKTWRGVGLDDRTATARLDWTDAGFHAMVLAAKRTVFIDPYAAGDLGVYVSYDKADLYVDPARHPRGPR